ncbi:acyl-CoA dehydrogenase, N-terminal domain protein, partial [Vibrio parahaemolyticus VP2007-007]
VISH